MRKKILLEQFDLLTESYEKCFFELSELKKEKEKLLERINVLENKLAQEQDLGFNVGCDSFEQIEESQENHETQPVEEKADTSTPVIDDAMEYGAKIIGNIIVESAKYCDMLTNKPSENTKDLINLIMGKSEICKSEILTIAIGEMDYNTKRELIDSQANDAMDYFKSVLAQI